VNTGAKRKVISSVLEQAFGEEQKKITSCREWIKFSKAHNNLYKAILKKGFRFNPKFNAVHWAFDIARLCNEIAFSYCWMNSYAKSSLAPPIGCGKFASWGVSPDLSSAGFVDVVTIEFWGRPSRVNR
jgi:hypothetical protein